MIQIILFLILFIKGKYEIYIRDGAGGIISHTGKIFLSSSHSIQLQNIFVVPEKFIISGQLAIDDSCISDFLRHSSR